MNRNRNLRSLLLTLLVLGLIAPAAHATVILDPTGISAIEIRDLAFDGNVYDITFVEAMPGSLYGAPPNLNLDFDDGNVVDEVIAAVNAELNTSTATFAGPDSLTWDDEYRIAWGYSLVSGSFSTSGGRSNGVPGNWGNADQLAGVLPTSLDVYAVFTVVPEPGTALLMGLGLAGLAAGGRGQRKATDETA
jgi:hypothetical protein